MKNMLEGHFCLAFVKGNLTQLKIINNEFLI